jgi:hypothetical protein
MGLVGRPESWWLVSIALGCLYRLSKLPRHQVLYLVLVSVYEGLRGVGGLNVLMHTG